MHKEMLNSPVFFRTNPVELKTFYELCVWLEAMLSGPCGIWEYNDGSTFVITQRALVERVKGLTIIINPNEHPPPHFHVKYSDNNISFCIKDCSLIVGNIGDRELKIVKHWHKYSQKKLIQKWNDTRPTNCSVGLY